MKAHEYEIKTERLLLRPMTVEDAEAVWKWVSDERVARYMVYPTYTDKEKLVDWLRSIEVFDGEYHFGFVRLSDGELIGSGKGDDRFCENHFRNYTVLLQSCRTQCSIRTCDREVRPSFCRIWGV